MFMKLEKTGHSTNDKQSRTLKWSGQILIRIFGALGKRVQHELKVAWICTEETGCFKWRVREQGVGTAGVWTESCPREAHLGCSPELIKVRPLPTHRVWERGPPCRCWLERPLSLQLWVFSGRHFIRRRIILGTQPWAVRNHVSVCSRLPACVCVWGTGRDGQVTGAEGRQFYLPRWRPS